jgi:hypothetical protein
VVGLLLIYLQTFSVRISVLNRASTPFSRSAMSNSNSSNRKHNQVGRLLQQTEGGNSNSCNRILILHHCSASAPASPDRGQRRAPRRGGGAGQHGGAAAHDATEGRRGWAWPRGSGARRDGGTGLGGSVGRRIQVWGTTALAISARGCDQGFFTNGNRNLYHGYRSYRCGAVIKTAG